MLLLIVFWPLNFVLPWTFTLALDFTCTSSDYRKVLILIHVKSIKKSISLYIISSKSKISHLQNHRGNKKEFYFEYFESFNPDLWEFLNYHRNCSCFRNEKWSTTWVSPNSIRCVKTNITSSVDNSVCSFLFCVLLFREFQN